MFNTDNINYIDLHLLEGQVDLILESLQLYAFNLHRVWAVDKNSDLEDLRNALLFHTYEEIVSKYNNCKLNYDVLGNCQLERKRKRNLIYIKNKKVS